MDEDWQAAEQLIADFWLPLASVAYTTYQAYGRGVFVLDRYGMMGPQLPGAVTAAAASLGAIPLAFLALAKLPPSLDGVGVLRAYDPATEAAFLVTTREGKTGLLILKGSPTPLEAYQQQQAALAREVARN